MLMDDHICHAWILGLGPIDFYLLEHFDQENSVI